ncbi:MIP family Ig-specific serine endopeptidase [[Mycoplasma] imitans]|uniref:MIP family Ig-specific serine endopeptidase n=1 Tax=[Mycoplasma] imitans TaxID=29560 RepID=UPI00048883FF|nr:DUF31 family protein [[Mycoplasma] imitans]
MLKRSAWFKLFCALSGLSVIASSCGNMKGSSMNEADAINLSNLTSRDLTVISKEPHDKVLASDINSSNFSNYFDIKLIKQAQQKQDPNTFVDISISDFVADDPNGVLTFSVNLTKKAINPSQTKQITLEIAGFLKKEETESTKDSANSDTTNKDAATQNVSTNQQNPNTNNSNKPDTSSSGTTLKVFNDQEIYKKIYDRSFSLEFYTHYAYYDKTKSTVDDLYYVTNGTGWLLDYQVDSNNPNLYRLFLATNLHVAQTLWNNNDFDRPVTDLDPKPETVGFSLGKSENPLFTAQNSRVNNSPVKYVSILDNQKFYDRLPNKNNVLRVDDRRLNIPKTIFAAVDFVNDQTTKEEFSSYWRDQFKQEFINGTVHDKNILERTYPKDEEERARIADKYIEKGIGLYKDFAVISFVVNISQKWFRGEDIQQYTNGSKLLRKYVLDAIDELKASSEIAKAPGQLNISNPNLPYIDIDYASVKYSRDNALSVDDIGKAYIAGYPGVKDSQQANAKINFRWVQNNINDDPNYQLANNIDSSLIDKTQDFNGLIQPYHNKYYHQYGITQKVERSSLRSGSSGSVVYSKYGLPFGIFWGGYNNISESDPNSNRGLFEYLANDKKILFSLNVNFADTGEQRRYTINVEPYNLIDGTDKTKYPNQTNSYRQSLAKYLASLRNDRFSKSTYLFSNP